MLAGGPIFPGLAVLKPCDDWLPAQLIFKKLLFHLFHNDGFLPHSSTLQRSLQTTTLSMM
jgi:hypothetical protein